MFYTVLIILCLFIIYAISIGINTAIIRYSEIFDKFIKTIFISNTRRKEFIALFGLLGPISIFMYILIVIGWVSYKITKYCLVR